MIIRKTLTLSIFLLGFLLLIPNKSNGFQNDNNQLEDSIKKYIYNNPDKAIPFIHKYIQTSKNKKKTLLGYGALGVAHEIKGSVDSTLYYYNFGLSLSETSEEIITFKYEIGKIYEQQYNYEYALMMYKQCYDLAKKDKLLKEYYKIENSLAFMENKIGQPAKALVLLKQMYKEAVLIEEDKSVKYIRKNLAETYLNVKQPDSALVLIENGIEDATKKNNVEFQYCFYKLKAEYFLLKEEFNKSLSDIDNAIDKAKTLNNTEYINEALFLKALINHNQKQHYKSIDLLKNILNNNLNKSPELLSKYYKLLADSYQEIDSNGLSVEYYKKFSIAEKRVTEKRLSTLDKIYDIDISEKINEKEKQKSKAQFWVIAFSFVSIFGILLFLRNRNVQKKNHKLFDELMIKINNYEENEKITTKRILDAEKNKTAKVVEINSKKNVDNLLEEKAKRQEDTGYIIDDEKVDEIILKLRELEISKYYLKQDCTMHNMAKKLKTNTSYLSKIINNQLNKTFSSYINELRINYVIIELKNNKRLRAYSVKGISEEIGYKSADSFSKYFKEATGLTPSVYIKKLSDIS